MTDLIEKAENVITTAKEELAQFVEQYDLHQLLDLQKDLDHLNTKVELWKHKITLVQLQIKAKYNLSDKDTIDSSSGMISRK